MSVLKAIVTVLMFILGAVMGSFACCQVWRLRLGDKSKRSHCLSCGYQLKWYDNIPVVSWLVLRGKCRKCGKPIGVMEILTEVGLGAVFALTFWRWPTVGAVLEGNAFELVRLVVFLLLLTALTICLLYDARFCELPVRVLHICIALAVVYAGLNVGRALFDALDTTETAAELFWQYLGAMMVLPGLYYGMYRVSHESWVGGGDWLLNVALALALGNFWLALFAMFLANILGCAVFLPPTLKSKKKHKFTTTKVPFGPFLVVAFWVIHLTQVWVLNLVAL